MSVTVILDFLMSTFLPFVFVLGLLIFIHELGHFLAAKWAGIRVERFSLGFPPRMFGKKIGDTDYCISWIPLGGYVKMAGMIDESFDEKIEGKPDEFSSKPIWKRVIVIAAGPFMNILLAYVLLIGIIYGSGLPVPSPEAVIGEIEPNSPAASAGLKPGDRILSVAGHEVNSWEELTKVIHGLPDSTIALSWEHEGSRSEARLKTMFDRERNIGRIGIGPSSTIRELSFGEAVLASGGYSMLLTRELGKTLVRLFSGKASVKKELAGPIQIMIFAGDFARQGFTELLRFMALISLQLGLLNILPIPVLDGGHLVFLGMEAIMRRPVSIKVRVVVQQIGMALLLALMVFILYNDASKVKWSQIFSF